MDDDSSARQSGGLPKGRKANHRKDPIRSEAARTRTAKACSSCATRRHKCDGAQPKCQRCQNNGLACVYGQPPPKTKHPSRPFQMRSGAHSSASPSPDPIDPGPSASGSGASYRSNGLAPVEQTIYGENHDQRGRPHTSRSGSSYEFSGSDLDASLRGVGSPDPRSLLRPVVGVPQFHLEFASLSLGGTGDGARRRSNSEQDATNWTQSQTQPAAISEDLFRRLIHQYFELVNCFWPLFVRHEIPDSMTSGIYGYVPAIAVNSMLLCAGGTVDGVSPEDQTTLDSLLWRTEREALVAAFESPSLATVQALIILAIKAHRMSRHTQSWNFVGVACRTAQHLALHRDRPQERDLQSRRRVYWHCYILDKLLGIETGRPWCWRRSDADTNLALETDAEESEVLSLMFPPDATPGSGYVVSTFNSYCRLAVIAEKIMDLRMNFSSAAARDIAVSAVDRVCRRWVDSLPAHLQINSERQQPANVLSAHAMHHCCVILLHISAAGDAIKLGRSPAEDLSLHRLVEASQTMGSMVSRGGRHYIISMQTALPFTFPPLLFASANSIIGSPDALAANQRVLAGLRQIRDEGRAYDSHASVTNKINSISSLDPEVPGPIAPPDDLFHRRPSYATQPLADPWMEPPPPSAGFDPYAGRLSDGQSQQWGAPGLPPGYPAVSYGYNPYQQ